MANTNNYAEQFSPDLLEILMQGTLTSPFITSNVKWVGARTFHFTQMSTTGFKNHSREGGWNKGKYTQTDVPFTCEHDRDIEFLVDKADVDETNATAKVENISKVFEQTQVAPETDALFFSKVAAKAQSTEFTRKIELTQIAEGGMGIETRVTEIDGCPIIEVIDDERFYDSFNFNPANGGFEPATGGHKINVLVACGDTCKTVPKISSIYFFAPGAHTERDGWLYQNRTLSDTFVFPNGKDGKIDSIYVDVDTTAVA